MAARDCGAMPKGMLWLDGNSCSPGSKRQAEEIIHAKGGRYVDLAIMAPVHPAGVRVPVLVSGPHAAAATDLLLRLGMNARAVGPLVGQASAIKMLRSVVIKGLEAITTECLLAARDVGVDAEVLASLQASDPGIDWAARSAYNLERMTSHGRRRAAEMDEVVRFLAELGLPAEMALATTVWQDRLGALGLDLADVPAASRADLLLSALRPAR
jgi:3-hydroxyisobutyrate dehydrogenase-like beta-hydroxyacid dehydrogenase